MDEHQVRRIVDGRHKGMSRRVATHIALVFAVIMAGACAAAADEAIESSGDNESEPANPCDQFGPGYLKLGGTETCIKIGGSVRVDIGGGDPQQGRNRTDR